MFGMDQQTFIIVGPMLINFIILAVILTLLLYKPVRAFLYERANRVARELDEAEAARQVALTLKAQYDQRLKDIEQERTAILDDARKLAMERRHNELAETRKEINVLKNRAEAEIIAERDRVKDQVEQAIVDISSEMAGKLLAVTIDTSMHNRLFDEAMAQLEATVFKPSASVTV